MNVKRPGRQRGQRLTRAESQAQTRVRLIEAACEVFQRRGYYAATIEEIVDAAGYSRGAFYANFSDKGDLFLAVLDQQRERQFGTLADQIDEAQDSEILPALRSWFSKMLSGPLERATAEFRLVAADNPEHRRRLAQHVGAMREVTARMVTHYCERHEVELTVNHDVFAAMVVATMAGFADQLRLDPGAVTLETVGLALTALWDGTTSERKNPEPQRRTTHSAAR